MITMNKQNELHIILFDGTCNLCSSIVKFIYRRDSQSLFYFSSLESSVGQELLIKNNLSTYDLDSFVYIEKDKVYKKSSAALHVFKNLGGLWKFLFIFIVVPKFIRDFFYELIAKNRYKVFGRSDSCLILNAKIKDRHLK